MCAAVPSDAVQNIPTGSSLRSILRSAEYIACPRRWGAPDLPRRPARSRGTHTVAPAPLHGGSPGPPRDDCASPRPSGKAPVVLRLRALHDPKVGEYIDSNQFDLVSVPNVGTRCRDGRRNGQSANCTTGMAAASPCPRCGRGRPKARPRPSTSTSSWRACGRTVGAPLTPGRMIPTI